MELTSTDGRILDGALVSDRKSTKTLLDNQNMLSVNQIAAQMLSVLEMFVDCVLRFMFSVLGLLIVYIS